MKMARRKKRVNADAAGTAAYSKEFTVGNPSGRTLLSLGEVHNLAEVIVN